MFIICIFLEIFLLLFMFYFSFVFYYCNIDVENDFEFRFFNSMLRKIFVYLDDVERGEVVN